MNLVSLKKKIRCLSSNLQWLGFKFFNQFVQEMAQFQLVLLTLKNIRTRGGNWDIGLLLCKLSSFVFTHF